MLKKGILYSSRFAIRKPFPVSGFTLAAYFDSRRTFKGLREMQSEVCILSRLDDDGIRRPSTYFSKVILAEANYPIFDKELSYLLIFQDVSNELVRRGDFDSKTIICFFLH